MAKIQHFCNHSKTENVFFVNEYFYLGIILIFALSKEPKVICFTIGEKGIRWKSGTIPVAVSPIQTDS